MDEVAPTARNTLIILDEPFTGLDPLVRDELIEVLLEIAEGATILISSHDIAEIETIASHIGISIAPPNPVFRGGSLTRLTRNVLAQDTSGRTL